MMIMIIMIIMMIVIIMIILPVLKTEEELLMRRTLDSLFDDTCQLSQSHLVRNQPFYLKQSSSSTFSSARYHSPCLSPADFSQICVSQ